jgi:hypothetical protein
MILDLAGFAHTRTEQVDLMELYRNNGRKLTRTVSDVFGEFLS